MRVDANKTELLRLISEILTSIAKDKELVATAGNHVISNTTIDAIDLDHCNHEEADTGIIVHLMMLFTEVFQKLKYVQLTQMVLY